MLLSHPKAELFRSARVKLDRAGIRCVSYYAATIKDADDIDDSILTTPQVNKTNTPFGAIPIASPGSGWAGQSPAVSSLMNFQRARLRHGKSRKSSSSGSGHSLVSPGSRSPPPAIRSIETAGGAFLGRDTPTERTRSRRESITWAANQLHISGSESDDGALKSTLENVDSMLSTPGRDGQRGVIRRAVTRRGNMLVSIESRLTSNFVNTW